jgi:hypothetical protein
MYSLENIMVEISRHFWHVEVAKELSEGFTEMDHRTDA